MYIIRVAPAAFIVSEKNEATLNQNSQYSNAHPRTANTPSALPLLSTITPPTYHQPSSYTHSSPPTIDKPDRTHKYTQSSLGKLSQLR